VGLVAHMSYKRTTCNCQFQTNSVWSIPVGVTFKSISMFTVTHTQLTVLRRLYYLATKFDLKCRLSSGHYTRTWMLTETKCMLPLRLYSFVFRFVHLWIISCFAQIIFTWSIPVGVMPKCWRCFKSHTTHSFADVYYLSPDLVLRYRLSSGHYPRTCMHTKLST